MKPAPVKNPTLRPVADNSGSLASTYEGNGQPHPVTPSTLGSWSACQTNTNPTEKEAMAKYFANHEFLVRRGQNGETHPRERAALFLVAPGTTPNTVVKCSLEWMRDHWTPNPYTITWYPLGALVPATLFEFKQSSLQCESAARLFLIPGEVDPQSESVIGKHPVSFLENLDVRLSGSILSAHRFDMATGTAYFYFGNESEVQRAGATFYSDDKFLFLDSSKFSPSGSPGYDVRDLLMSAKSVTIFTVTSSLDDHIIEQFRVLCERVLETKVTTECLNDDGKRLRLCIVSLNGEPITDIPRIGRLPDSRPESAGRNNGSGRVVGQPYRCENGLVNGYADEYVDKKDANNSNGSRKRSTGGA